MLKKYGNIIKNMIITAIITRFLWVLFTYIQNIIANIKIIGVGGAGTNAVNRMVMAGISDVQLYAVNTDMGSLKKSSADTKISIGTGLGVGGDPEKGKKYAEDSIDKFREMLQGSDMIFITTGMGGGTGTGAAPVIAKYCKDAGILTVIGKTPIKLPNWGTQKSWFVKIGGNIWEKPFKNSNK